MKPDTLVSIKKDKAKAQAVQNRVSLKSSYKPSQVWIRKDVVSTFASMDEYDLSTLSKVFKSNKVISLVASFSFNATYNNSVWYMDSGCSHHMTGNKAYLSNYESFNGGAVRFGDGVESKIIGKGTYRKDGMEDIKDVYHVENCKVNLVC